MPSFSFFGLLQQLAVRVEFFELGVGGVNGWELSQFLAFRFPLNALTPRLRPERTGLPVVHDQRILPE
jgi:hypothetical protein